MTSDIFIPTYLYIKQHSVTGKLYFGKTTKNPEIYLGSGSHWKLHIKKHGKEHVVTLWYCLFLDQESITDFALSFSEQQNIVESEEWLNLKPENGLDGNPTGIIFSDTHKLNIRQSRLDYFKNGVSEATIKANREHSKRMSGKGNSMYGKSANKGKTFTIEHREKISNAQKGKIISEEIKEKMSIGTKKSYENGRIVNCAKPITINGITYRSMLEASKSTGISIYRLRLLSRK